MSVFNTLAIEYDSWFDSDGKLIFDTEVKALRKVLPPEIIKPSIEVGVGSGRFARALNIEFGIDPAIHLLEIATTRQINAIQGIGELLPFKDNCFGTVFIIATLCFVKCVAKVFNEAHRILQSDGNLILGAITASSSWGRFYEIKKQEGHPFYKYATFYEFNHLEMLLKASGFSIINIVSTLRQQPNEVRRVESPEHGLRQDSGFVAIIAKK